MTTLTDRPCRLGLNLNVPTAMSGDERVPAASFQLVGVMLEKDEVDELVGELFWNSIFDTPAGDNKAPRCAFPKLAPYKLLDKYEGSVVIAFGPNQMDMELDECQLSSITLQPMEGGLVQMSLTVYTTGELDTNKLKSRLDTEVNAEIVFGDTKTQAKSKQKELPINTFGDGEHKGAPGDDTDDGDEKKRKAHLAALENSQPTKKPAKRGRARNVH